MKSNLLHLARDGVTFAKSGAQFDGYKIRFSIVSINAVLLSGVFCRRSFQSGDCAWRIDAHERAIRR